MTEELKDEKSQILHWVIHALYAIVLLCGGAITNELRNQIRDNREKVDAVPLEYVLKSDYKYDRDSVAAALQALATKMDYDKKDIKEDYNRRSDKLEKLIIETLGKK